MMDAIKAAAILAFCIGTNAAALPQGLTIGGTTAVEKNLEKRQLGALLPISVPGVSLPSVSLPTISLPVSLPAVTLPVSVPALPVVSALSISVPALPIVSSLPVSVPALPVVSSLPVSVPALPIVSSLPVSVPALPVVSSLPVSVPVVPVVSSVPVAPLGAVTGAIGSVTGGSSPVGVITGATSAAPVVGGLLSNSPPSYAAPYPIGSGIPGTDPVGAFSISVIATLLSLLQKDPAALFSPASPLTYLTGRDLPELHRTGIPELAKRQLGGLPSLSSGIPGVGVGGLSGSGIPGISPDLSFLVGNIAKNIAVPGGTGLGSVTGSILAVLNSIIPNFIFQLPVVQDSVATFGVLQLLAAINPTKFGAFASLTTLPALSTAVSQLPASDLAFVKALPNSPDSTNLVTTIMTFANNILSLPGNVANLKASVSALAMKNLGLSVPGLS